MNLPTQAEVNAVTRHVGTLAGGVIVGFGLSQKINPDTVQQLITAGGTVVNDIVVFLGIVGPIASAWYAKQSSSLSSQASSVAAAAAAKTLPVSAQVAVLNAAADVPGTQKVINPTLSSDPATSDKVTNQ